MSILSPILSANLVVQSQTSPVTTAEERQVDLRPEQMVRATVVEGGLDKALLEMNHRHYRAQSDIELQGGQKLTLQVLQTHPQLEFRIINDPLGERLSQLLPMLTRPYDWARLLDSLRLQPQRQDLPSNTAQIYQQLSQLLQPAGRLPATIEDGLGKLPRQLQQLSGAVANGQRGTEIPSSVALEPQPSVSFRGAASTSAEQLLPLVRNLQGQLAGLQGADGRPLPQAWLAETRQLLAPLQQSLPRTQVPLAQLIELSAVLGQMRQQPSLPPRFSAELERLMLQLTVQSGRDLSPAGRLTAQASASPAVIPPTLAPPAANPSAQAAQILQGASPQAQPGHVDAAPQPQGSQAAAGATVSAGVYRPSIAAGFAPQAEFAPVVPADISAGLEKLLTQVQQAQDPKGGLSPALLGRLEGLLDRLNQLPQMAQPAQPVLPGLEIITSQLMQIVQQGPQHPEGGQLGFLSQLFGFYLEAELLKGKKKEALASLKLSLLAMQKELGEKVEEPLRRLEMFQLCKARLAEDQVQFLPLPFNELEEGYLLMEKPQDQDGDEAAGKSLQLSLSLRLSALGNIRVDMLYDHQGLHLRMASEDNQKMAYLQMHVAELEESVASVPLRGISFSADAEMPTRKLLQHLVPDALGMLDTRI